MAHGLRTASGLKKNIPSALSHVSYASTIRAWVLAAFAQSSTSLGVHATICNHASAAATT